MNMKRKYDFFPKDRYSIIHPNDNIDKQYCWRFIFKQTYASRTKNIVNRLRWPFPACMLLKGQDIVMDFWYFFLKERNFMMKISGAGTVHNIEFPKKIRKWIFRMPKKYKPRRYCFLWFFSRSWTVTITIYKLF